MNPEMHRNKNWTSVFFGLLVAILPWLGLPLRLKNWLLLACGLVIALVALSGQRRLYSRDQYRPQ